MANEFHGMKILFDTNAANKAWNKTLWIYISLECGLAHMCGMDNAGREVYTVHQSNFQLADDGTYQRIEWVDSRVQTNGDTFYV